MEYTVKALADLAGVTPRTLRWYDRIGLLNLCGPRSRIPPLRPSATGSPAGHPVLSGAGTGPGLDPDHSGRPGL